MKAREYIQPTDEDSLEQLKIRVQSVQDFWKRQRTHLPKLHQLAFDFAFLPSSSASVERTFSYFKKLLSDDRERMEETTTEYMLFLYVNSSFIQ